jgi:hypothetical protein
LVHLKAEVALNQWDSGQKFVTQSNIQREVYKKHIAQLKLFDKTSPGQLK